MSRQQLALVAAKAVLGLADTAELCDVAVQVLNEGWESPALVSLAGLSPVNDGEARSLFGQVLEDAGVPVPSARDAVLQLARVTAQEIVDERVAPQKGAELIWKLTLRASDHEFPELHSFVYAASEWDDRTEDGAIFEDGVRRAAASLTQAS